MESHDDFDRLSYMLDKQTSFLIKVAHTLPAETDARVRELSMYLVGEVVELLNTLKKWKSHRNVNSAVLRRSAMLEELIDIFKFWLCLVSTLEYRPSDILTEFKRKSRLVELRYQQEFLVNYDCDNLCVVDMDGVVCDYIGGFIKFIEREYKFTPVQGPYDPVAMLVKSGMSWKQAYAAKEDYRENGGKLNLEPKEQAREALELLAGAGKKIVILTSRPYEHKRVWADTVQWLDLHLIPYDSVIIAEDKRKWMAGLPATPDFFADDQMNYITGALELGVKNVFIIRTVYNDCLPAYPGDAVRAASLYEAVRIYLEKKETENARSIS